MLNYLKHVANSTSGTSGSRSTPAVRTPSGGSSSPKAPRYWAQIDLKPWEVALADVELEKCVGQGSYGKVGSRPCSRVCVLRRAMHRAACREHTNSSRLSPPSLAMPPAPTQVYLGTLHETQVAVKVLLNVEELERRPEAVPTLSSPQLEELQKEAALMATLLHPNIIQLIGVCAMPPAMVIGGCQTAASSRLQLGRAAALQACCRVGCSSGCVVPPLPSPCPYVHTPSCTSQAGLPMQSFAPAARCATCYGWPPRNPRRPPASPLRGG